MKTSSDFLWRLIRTMSQKEKLFFRRNFSVSKKGDQHLYLRLFDAINTQKEYNEELLLKKFSPALTKKNIAVQKNYLLAQISEAITFYEYRNNDEHAIIRLRLLIRLYRKRGLLDEALLVWKKAIQRARSLESFAFSALLKLEFEKMLLVSGSHTRYNELLEIFNQNVITYEDYAELNTLRDIYAEIILIRRNAHFDISAKDKKRILELYQIVSKYERADDFPSFWFRHYFFICKNTLQYLMGESSLALPDLKLLYQNWKNHSKFVSSHGEHYLEMLYLINYCGVQCGDFDFVTLVYADSLNQLLEDDTLKINFEAYRFMAMNRVYNKTGNYRAVQQLLEKSKVKISQWEPYLNDDINRTIHFSVSISYFVLGDYEHALSFAKSAVAYITMGVRKELFSIGQLFLLLITYCMNNERLFEAQYRATYGFFYKRNKHDFEKAVIDCLRHTFYVTDIRERINQYKRAIEIFEKNNSDVFQQNVFTIFNFKGWLESQVLRITYRKYVEQKIKTAS